MCSIGEESPVQGWLKSFLFVWLIATAVRQAFDLIGRLWIPVLVNLIQILTLIAGIFAVYQKRAVLLIVLSVSCLFSILYNVALILWYNNVFGDSNRPLLTLGLPHGYSFFVQHTPFCDSFFNVTTARWSQKESCIVGYTVSETIQAALHIILAFATILFSIFMARQRKTAFEKHSKAYTSRTQLNKMHVIASVMPKPNNCRAPNSDSSTSYMNSSYENPENLAEPQMRRKMPPNSTSKFLKHKNIEQNDNFSSAPTIELNSNKSNVNDIQMNEPPKPQRMLRSLPERRSCGAQLAKILDQSTDSTSRYSKIVNSSNQQRRRCELRPTSSATNAVKLNEEEDFNYLETRSRIAARLANLNGEPSVTKNSPHHKRQGSAGNLTSLISFDPKSENLIQVHSHQNESDDEDRINHENQPSVPIFPAPPRVSSSEQASDSGHHSTNSNSSNWSQAGISFPTQLRLAEMGTKSPESINYDQIGYPLVQTSFPVTHTRQRSYCGVTAATSIPLTKQNPEDAYYYQQRNAQLPITTQFSRTFHDRWISGDRSNEDLPPLPKPISLMTQDHNPDPRIEGLLV